MKRDLTHQRLRELLNYDPSTGLFKWLQPRRGTARVGGIAGATRDRGYISISIDGFRYAAHRLAWFYTHGVFPSKWLDHINGVPSDNRIANLREVSCAENQQNMRKAKSNSKSGVLGVGWHPTDRKWRARIRVDGKVLFIGNFDSQGDAEAAYITKKRELHPFGEL